MPLEAFLVQRITNSEQEQTLENPTVQAKPAGWLHILQVSAGRGERMVNAKEVGDSGSLLFRSRNLLEIIEKLTHDETRQTTQRMCLTSSCAHFVVIFQSISDELGCGCHVCVSCGPVQSGLQKTVVRGRANTAIPGGSGSFFQERFSSMKAFLCGSIVVVRHDFSLVPYESVLKVEKFVDCVRLVRPDFFRENDMREPREEQS